MNEAEHGMARFYHNSSGNVIEQSQHSLWLADFPSFDNSSRLNGSTRKCCWGSILDMGLEVNSIRQADQKICFLPHGFFLEHRTDRKVDLSIFYGVNIF